MEMLVGEGNCHVRLNATGCVGGFHDVHDFRGLLEVSFCNTQAQDRPTDYDDSGPEAQDAQSGDFVVADENGTFVLVVNNDHLRSLLLNGSQLDTLVGTDYCRQLPNLQELDVSANRLRELRQLDLVSRCTLTLQRLLLDSNRLTALEAGFLQSFANLTSFSCRNNLLATIEDRAFTNLTRLETLNLSGNRLQIISTATFAGLTGCRTLDLSGNRLKDANFLQGADDLGGSLLTLDLANNGLEELERPDVFKKLLVLETLRLAGNRLTALAGHVFAGLSRLQELDLDDNRLAIIDAAVFAFGKDLTVLSLSGNRLTSVPPFAERLLRLKRLELDGNRLRSLPDEAFHQMPILEHLDLSANNISALADRCFDGLDQLRTLRLRKNQLNDETRNNSFWGHPTFFANYSILTLKKLVTLDLSVNDLREFGAFNLATTALLNLNVSHNPKLARLRVQTENAQAFKLITLDASHGAIRRLDAEHVFLGGAPTTLRALYLDHNRIDRVRSDFFAKAVHLKLITLNNNQLTTLELASPSVDAIQRARGGARGFRPADGQGDSIRSVLRLGRNPWLCDCHLGWLKNTVDSPGQKFLVEDYDQLWCFRRFHRFQEPLVQLSTATIDRLNSTDFLCSFPTSGPCQQSSRNKCDPTPCPRRCACFRSSRWNTVIVDCHAANLTSVPSDGIPATTTSLYLDDNDIRCLEAGSFTFSATMASLQSLFLNHSRLASIELGALSTQVAAVRRLFLQGNQLTSLPADVFYNLTHLVELNLAHNELASLGSRLFAPLKSLQILRLNDNNLTVEPLWTILAAPSRLDNSSSSMSTSLFSSHLSSISVFDNPWSCECSFALDFTAWMSNVSRKLVESDRIYCLKDGPDANKVKDKVMASEKILFNWFDESVCVQSVAGITGVDPDQVLVLATSLAVLTAVAILAVITFVYRQEIQVLVYSRYGVRLFHRTDGDAAMDAAKTFDAFLSYSSLDEEFVINDLLPGLEAIERPYRLCLHHRDFPIGAFINESIIQAIDDSRRTILLLSPNFVRSEWCRFEFRTAHSLMLQDRRNRVIVIVLGTLPKNDPEMFPEMKHYLRTNTYLSWGDNFFWKKLYFVLPEIPKAEVEPEVDPHNANSTTTLHELT